MKNSKFFLRLLLACALAGASLSWPGTAVAAGSPAIALTTASVAEGSTVSILATVSGVPRGEHHGERLVRWRER